MDRKRNGVDQKTHHGLCFQPVATTDRGANDNSGLIGQPCQDGTKGCQQKGEDGGVLMNRQCMQSISQIFVD